MGQVEWEEVLDGQQRLTSMFLALKSGRAVNTTTEKGVDIERIYFLDMKLCLDEHADRESAVASLPATLIETEDFGRKIIRDLSTPQLQFAQRLFPVALLFDAAGYANWTMAYLAYHGHSPDEAQFLMKFQQSVWLRFQEYRIPVIKLTEDTPRAAVCQVFEKVNTGGVVLTVFELVTATFAVENFELRPDWESRQKKIIEKRPALDVVDGTSFLTAITLLASYERSLIKNTPVSCKRADVLELTLGDYRTLADSVQEGFRKAAEPTLVWMLSSYLAGRTSGRVFQTASGKPHSRHNVWRKLKLILKSLGLRPGGLHAFRHGRVSMLQANGMPGDLLLEQVGHSDLKTTSGYTHFNDAFRQRMARVQGLFSQEDGPNGPKFPDFPSTGRVM